MRALFIDQLELFTLQYESEECKHNEKLNKLFRKVSIIFLLIFFVQCDERSLIFLYRNCLHKERDKKHIEYHLKKRLLSKAITPN